MKYLLDTHILLWYLENNPNLSQKMKDLLEDTTHELYLSMASLWEIAIKISIKKLDLQGSFTDLRQSLKELNINIIPIGEDDSEKLIVLPLHHRDPFDRMIIVQSQNLSIPIITKDEYFSLYDIGIIWF